MTTDKAVSRREFARRAALGAASASLLPLGELVPEASAPPSAPRAIPEVATPQPVQAGQPDLSPEGRAEAATRYQAILTLYPNRFSDAQKTDLQRLCATIQPSLDRLRAYTVSNGDLPALFLKPLVERDKTPASREVLNKSAATKAGSGAASTAQPQAPAPPSGKP